MVVKEVGCKGQEEEEQEDRMMIMTYLAYKGGGSCYDCLGTADGHDFEKEPTNVEKNPLHDAQVI